MWSGIAEALRREHPRRPVVPIAWDVFGAWLMEGRPPVGALSEALDQPLWVGWSLGGALLLEAVAQGRLSPEHALVVGASPSFLVHEDWPGVSLAALRGLRRQALRDVDAALSGFDAWLGLDVGTERQRDSEMLVQGLDWLAAIDRRDEAGSGFLPVDWMVGDRDPLVPSAERMTDELARVHLVPGAGHGLPFTHSGLLFDWVASRPTGA